jgi:HK97 family phage portal protein
MAILNEQTKLKLEKEALEQNWRKSFGGGKKANIPILAPVKLSWVQMGLKSADMELLDADKLSLEQIAQVYNVPLPLVSDKKATYNNLQEAKKDLWQSAIIPQLTAMRDQFNKEVVSRYNKAKGVEYWTDFDLKAVPALAEDKDKKSAMILQEMEHGMHTIEEARMLLDYEQIKGDEFTQKRMLKSGLRFVDETLVNLPTNDKPKDEN